MGSTPCMDLPRACAASALLVTPCSSAVLQACSITLSAALSFFVHEVVLAITGMSHDACTG